MFLLTLLVGVLQVISAILAGVFSKKFGSKSLLFQGSIICSVFLALFGIISSSNSDVSKILSVLCIFGYILFFGVSLGPVVWAYNAEILDGKGLAAATIANWSSAMLLIFFFPMVISVVPIEAAFIFFAVCTVATSVFVKRKVLETKDLSLAQIKEMYADNCKPKTNNIKEQIELKSFNKQWD